MEILGYFKKILLGLVLLMVATNMAIIIYQTYQMYALNQTQQFRMNAIKKPVRFFQIGFSKCGTKTLSDFFNSNAVPSIHHDGGFLAIDMHNNYKNGLPLLSETYKGYYGFFDMERLYDQPLISIPYMLFKELDKQYPGSKFIFNIRDKQAWLRSKAFHPAYHHNMRWINLHAKFLNISTDEVLRKWSQEWDDHMQAVLEYFKDRPNDLLIFNIDKDRPEKLCEFFKDNFKLNPKFYVLKNRSIDREKEKVVNY